jgi:hypothetical protein
MGVGVVGFDACDVGRLSLGPWRHCTSAEASATLDAA